MTTPSTAEPASGYTAQLEVLRSTAKWLTAAFAGVGGILVAGLQLTGIGDLPVSSWRLYVALGTAGVALTSVGFMIRMTSTVLTHEWLTLASFSDEYIGALSTPGKDHRKQQHIAKIRDELNHSRHELYGYAAPDIEQLHRSLREADEEIWRTQPASENHAEATRRAAMIRRAAREAVQYANYHYTLDLFRAMRAKIAIAALVVAVSAGTFAYATNPPKKDEPVKVRVEYAR
jgi:hypothetical protein